MPNAYLDLTSFPLTRMKDKKTFCLFQEDNNTLFFREMGSKRNKL